MLLTKTQKTEKAQLILKTPFDSSNNSGAIDVRMGGSVLEKKSFKILGVSFYSKLYWGYYIVSRSSSNKIGALLFGSINLPYRLAWNTVLMSEWVHLAAN